MNNIFDKLNDILNEAKVNWVSTLQSLNDKELFVIGLILGFKPAYRKREIENNLRSLKPEYQITPEEFDMIKDRLSKKGVLTKTGSLKNSKEVKEAWKQIVGAPYPSQLHQWAIK